MPDPILIASEDAAAECTVKAEDVTARLRWFDFFAFSFPRRAADFSNCGGFLLGGGRVFRSGRFRRVSSRLATFLFGGVGAHVLHICCEGQVTKETGDGLTNDLLTAS